MTDTTETERVDSPLSTIRSIEPPETNSKSRFGALRFREKPCSWVFCIIRPISTINIGRARGGELVAKCMYPPLPAGAQEYLHGRFDLSRAPTLIPPHSPSSFFCPDRAKIEIYFWRYLRSLLDFIVRYHPASSLLLMACQVMKVQGPPYETSLHELVSLCRFFFFFFFEGRIIRCVW